MTSRKVKGFGERGRVIVERLARQIAPAVENARLYHESKQLGLALESIGDAVIFCNPSGYVRFINQSFADMFGYSIAELIGKDSIIIVLADDASQVHAREILKAAHDGPWQGEVKCIRRNGEQFDVHQTLTAVKDQNDTAIGYVGVLQDITQRKALQSQLLQSQKMESIGQLASGIVHDFNNGLTAIMGYSQFGIAALGPTHPVKDHLKTIRLATERATNLTDQLLVFSRQKPIEEKAFDLNILLIDQGKLVNSVLGRVSNS